MKLPLLPWLGPPGLRLALRRRSRNSIIMGGPLGWRWVSHIDEQHHGALSGPPGAHRHADLSSVGPDDHHARDHHARHEDGGSDQMDVTGLSGLLADPQTPLAHAASHENGGADEIDVGGLSGLLADPQTPLSHAVTHQDGGGDEINVAGLSGLLADQQTPAAHQAGHQSGGADALAGLLDANARVAVRKNTGAVVGTRRRLNLIEGSGVALTMADDAVDEEVDVTLAASAAIALGRPKAGATTLGRLPGPLSIVGQSTQNFVNNTDYFFPIAFEAAVIVDFFTIEVTAPGPAGSKGRMALYRADTDLQPTGLVYDTGQFPVDAAGVLDVAVGVAAPAGVYLVGYNQNGQPTLRILRVTGYPGINPVFGATAAARSLSALRAHAPFPDPGAPWNTAIYVGASNGMDWIPVIKWRYA